MNTQPMPTACANLTCRNLPGEGAFALVTYTLTRYPDDATRGLPDTVTLMVCGPCAETLRRSS